MALRFTVSMLGAIGCIIVQTESNFVFELELVREEHSHYRSLPDFATVQKTI